MARRKATAPRRRRTSDDEVILVSVWAAFAYRPPNWDEKFLRTADAGEPLATFGGDARMVAALAWEQMRTAAPKIERDQRKFFAIPRAELGDRVRRAMDSLERHPSMLDHDLRTAAARILGKEQKT